MFPAGLLSRAVLGGWEQLPGPPSRPGSLCWRPCRPPGTCTVGIGLSLSHFTLVGSYVFTLFFKMMFVYLTS